MKRKTDFSYSDRRLFLCCYIYKGVATHGRVTDWWQKFANKFAFLLAN